MESQEKEYLIEELRKVNQKLVHSERLKTNFLSNIRNEINNPLTAIQGLLNNLISNGSPDHEHHKIFQLLYSDVFNLDFQLRNIFLSAELESGSIALCPSKVNVKALINEQFNRFRHIIREKDIKTDLKLNLEGHFITDPGHLSMVIGNLISNAVRFCSEGGSISIDAGIDGNRLVFTISNTGSRISNEDRQLIYDRFRQVEEGTTKKYGGHGLGLSIVKSVLEYFNGDIELKDNVKESVCFQFSCEELISDDIKTESQEGNDFIFVDDKDTIF